MRLEFEVIEERSDRRFVADETLGEERVARLVALGGFHQQSLEAGATCQLIRIHLPSEARLFPEISAGRHRFTARFLEQPKTTARPTQTARDVEFGLQCCLL